MRHSATFEDSNYLKYEVTMNKMLLSLLALSSSLVFASVPDDSYAQARNLKLICL